MAVLLVHSAAAVLSTRPAPRPSVPRTAARTAASLPLRIDGTWYDLRDYADSHPGGRWLLEYCAGRDVTALFRATHMLGESTAAAALKKLPTLDEASVPLPSRAGLPPSHLAPEGLLQGPYVVELHQSGHASPSPPPLPPIDSALRDELRAMMRRRFPTREAMKATRAHWARTALAAALCAACWVGWLSFNPLAIALLPGAQWLLAAHTVHEATHGALSADSRVNFWAQFTAHPILFNVFVWVPQHLISHHQYTNDPQHDVDVHHFAPARLAASLPAPYVPPSGFNQGWTFVWKGCLTTLGTCILQPLRTLTEKPTPNFDVNLTPIPSAVSKRTLVPAPPARATCARPLSRPPDPIATCTPCLRGPLLTRPSTRAPHASRHHSCCPCCPPSSSCSTPSSRSPSAPHPRPAPSCSPKCGRGSACR